MSVARRVAITIGAPLACLAIARIPAPGIQAELLAGGSPAALGVLALGITPAVTAYALVEIASVIVPRWRGLRHGGPEARRKLERAANIVMLLLAFAQAYASARFAELGDVASTVGVGPMLLRMGTWIAGACFSLLVARWISRQGILNGFVLLSLVALAVIGSTPTAGQVELPSGRQIGLSIAAVVLLALSVIVALRVLRPKTAPEVWIPVPASSIAPYYGAVDALSLLLAIAFTNPVYAPSVRMLDSSGLRPVLLMGICSIATIALTRQFHRPARVRELLAKIDPERAPRRAAIETAIFRALAPTLLLFVCMIFAETTVSRAGRSLAWVPLALAALFDASDAFRVHLRERDLECVWEERRPYAVPALVAMLDAERIAAWPLQLGQQVMLQIFGPYVPVELWVRKADAERARALIDSKLSLAPVAPESEEDRTNAPVPALPARSRLALGLLGLFAVLSIGLSAVPRRAARTERSHRAELEIVAVDDSVNPFENVDEAALPRGVSIMREPGFAGETWHYARVIVQPGESEAALRARVLPWFQKLSLPSDTRLAFGREREALRSYLLRGPAAVTQKDVRRATPVVDRERGEVSVGVELENEAAERFRILTRDQTRRRIAIVVDGQVMSAPLVREEIGHGRITLTLGSESFESQLEEAEALANALGGS